MNKPDLTQVRHSCAHLLASAVKQLWPGAQNAIGPAIENGFYQDFDMQEFKISEENFAKIEKKMREILKSWGEFKVREVSIEQAKKDFADNPYKLELIEEFAKAGKTITENDPGNFLDLCKGGHAGNPQKEMQHFRLLSIAGAYWRGDEKNKMLTRIYGTCFPTREELDAYLKMLEEAKKRDHRKLGKELDLYVLSAKVGPGLPLLTPKGTIIRQELDKLSQEKHKAWGYSYVTTPNLGDLNLYRTSGHYPYYAETMFPPIKDDEMEFMLRPMNCPHHIQIYDSHPRSYRELPLRLREDGLCYRYEKSGELGGLTRVRALTIDDAHIFCTPEQMEEEINRCIDLAEEIYDILGFKNISYTLSLRDPNNKKKYVGTDEGWNKAEKILREALKKRGVPFQEFEGEAAFYGPKIDVKVKDVLGREWQLATIPQIDYNMPERFDLHYIDDKGEKKRPIILHRAIYGSYERFMGLLIEHFAGAFPVWLSPVQVIIIPVAAVHSKAAQEIVDQMKQAGIRAELSAPDETLGKRIRQAEMMKVPYMAVLGDKEIESKKLNIRDYKTKEQQEYSVAAFMKKIGEEIAERSL